jgi:hypothetical protein
VLGAISEFERSLIIERELGWRQPASAAELAAASVSWRRKILNGLAL